MFNNIDPNLEKIADKIKSNILRDNSTEGYGSIILTVMIISVILTLVRVMQECNSSKLRLFNKKEKAYFMKKSIQKECIKKNILSMWRLNKILKQKLTTEDYKLYGKQLKNAILDVGGAVLYMVGSYSSLEPAGIFMGIAGAVLTLVLYNKLVNEK